MNKACNFFTFFTIFDIFGQSINLLVRRKSRYTTPIGGGIAFAIYVFTMFSFVQMVIEMTNRKTPSILQRSKLNIQKNMFEYTPENYFISLAVTDHDYYSVENLQNQTYFEVEFHRYLPNPDINATSDVMIEDVQPAVKCSENKILKNITDILNLTNFELQAYHCPDYQNWENNPLKIGDKARFFIVVKLCKNDSSKSYICASKEQMAKKLNGGRFDLMIFDKLLDQSRQGNPFETYPKSMIYSFNGLETAKFVNIYLKPTSISTLNNLFYYYEEYEIHEELQFSSFYESLELQTKEEIVAKFSFFQDQQRIQFERRYQNILNVFGSISGLFGGLITIFALIIGPLTKIYMSVDIVNKVFTFETEKKESQPVNRGAKRSSQQKSSKIMKLSKILRRMYSAKFNDTQDDFLKNFLKQKNKKIAPTWYDKITLFFSQSRRYQINFGINKIKKKTDVIYIIRKLIEFDKLKELLLTSDQIKLFDYMPKPTIPLYHKKKSDNKSLEYFQDQKNFSEQVREALDAYRIIMKQQQSQFSTDSKSLLDQKLINLLDDEVRRIFDLAIQDEQPELVQQQTDLKQISTQDQYQINDERATEGRNLQYQSEYQIKKLESILQSQHEVNLIPEKKLNI